MASTVEPWRAWVAATRPATLPASLAPIAVGSALALADGRFRLEVALLAAATALLLQIGTNLHNDWADFARGADDAARLGPPRATERGWLTGRAVRGAAIGCFALATLVGLALVRIGGWPILALGVASVAAGLLYTGGPAPLAYLGLGELFVLLFFGGAAVGGSYYLHATALSPQALLAAFAMGALAAAILMVNNLRDRAGDARAGKRTLVVRLGERFGRRAYALLLGGAYAVAPLAALASGRIGWMAPWLSLPLALAAIARVRRRDGAALNPELGATARLGLVYAALLCVGVLS